MEGVEDGGGTVTEGRLDLGCLGREIVMGGFAAPLCGESGEGEGGVKDAGRGLRWEFLERVSFSVALGSAEEGKTSSGGIFSPRVRVSLAIFFRRFSRLVAWSFSRSIVNVGEVGETGVTDGRRGEIRAALRASVGGTGTERRRRRSGRESSKARGPCFDDFALGAGIVTSGEDLNGLSTTT